MAGTQRREEKRRGCLPRLSMAPYHSWSSCSYNGFGGVQNRSGSSNRDGSKRLDSMPVCYCGEKVVLRTARTPKNREKQFWGCPKYKVRSMELFFFV